MSNATGWTAVRTETEWTPLEKLRWETIDRYWVPEDDGGESPAWTCPECGRDYVRETDDSAHALDLYGRGPPE